MADKDVSVQEAKAAGIGVGCGIVLGIGALLLLSALCLIPYAGLVRFTHWVWTW